MCVQMGVCRRNRPAGAESEGRWEQRAERFKERKKRKSNAYFGKSLVRLACNREKNKEKSDWKLKKETDCKKKQLKIQRKELKSHYYMVSCSSSREEEEEEE